MKRATGIEPITAADWTFHFELGCRCLEFVATVGDGAHRAFDRLRMPEDLARWCIESGLLKASPVLDTKHLEQARLLREAIYRIIEATRAGMRPHWRDVEELNGRATRPALVPQLGSRGRMVDWISDDPFSAALSTLARDAIALIVSPDLGRLRKCAAPTCSVLFLDGSRPGKRRWCSMSRCGNKIKKASYRQRRRESAVHASPADKQPIRLMLRSR